MTDLVAAARLLWCRGLAQTRGRPSKSIQEWLSTATFAPSLSNKDIFLTGVDEKELLAALAFDINRLSMAACETLRNISEIQEVPKSMGWPYVKLYYAALFYCHTLLRIWGKSANYLRTTDLILLRSTINAYGLSSPFTLSTGQYLIVADIDNTQAVLSQDRGGGGSHDAVWRELSKAFSTLKIALSNSQLLQVDKARLQSQIDQAQNLLSSNGSNPAWLSFMRNDINYKQAEGVWYPYKGRARTSELSNLVTQAMSETTDYNQFLISSGSDLVRFRSGCLFLISFARAVIRDLSKTGGNKSFIRFGQAQFENAFP